MTRPTNTGDLAGHPFLQGLSATHLERLAAAATPFSAAPGEYLTRDGEAADVFYLIESGRVVIGTHLAPRGDVPIQTLGPGDVVGWSWLLPPHQWQFDAWVVDAVEGFVFDAAWLREQCEQDHDLGYHLLKHLFAVVSSRLVAFQILQLDIYR
jgi:CRP-like cAMP-binding protein